MRSCSRSAAGVCTTVRFGFGTGTGVAVSSFPILLQAASASAAHSKAGAAQRRRHALSSRRPARYVKSATEIVVRSIRTRRRPHPCYLRLTHAKTGAQSSDHTLIPTQHLDLPHPEQLDPWSSPRPDIAADTNPSVFE